MRAVPSENVALALAPRAFVHNIRKSFTDSHDQRTRHCVLEEFSILRVQHLRWFAVRNPQSGVLARSRIVNTQQSG
eukprot:9484836-Pyramimonas_sp.AAC.1